MNQNERDRVAIKTVLSQMGEATFSSIALRAGEGLGSPLMEMVQEGIVVQTKSEGLPTLYRLRDDL